jgi:hypothetical protein
MNNINDYNTDQTGVDDTNCAKFVDFGKLQSSFNSREKVVFFNCRMTKP